MENKPTKEEKPRLQLVISALVATSFTLAEMYVMINQPANIVLIIGIAVFVLMAVYFVIDAIMGVVKEKENDSREQYDNIYRTEKTSYKLLRKNLDELSHLIQDTNSRSKDTEELVNVQKALAKISFNKSKENAEMVLAKVAKLEALLEDSAISTGGVDDEKRDRLFIELNNLEASLNDRLHGLSDKLSGFQEEIERLAEHIARINMEAISEAMKTSAGVQAVQSENDNFANLNFDDNSVLEEENVGIGLNAFADMDDIDLETDISDIEIPDVDEAVSESEEDLLSQLLEEMESAEEVVDEAAEITPAEEITPTEEKLTEEKPIEEKPVEEKPVEEKPAMPDMSNPNKMMTPEEIAALIANI